jgi:hypothetical protein
MDTKKNWHHRWTQSSARLVVVLALFLWYGICGAQTPSPTPPAMEVVFLGTGGPRAAGRAASWNLILIHGKARLLVDKARSKDGGTLVKTACWVIRGSRLFRTR